MRNWKKILVAMFLVMFLFASVASASGPVRFSKDQVLETYVSVNTTASPVTTSVSTSTITTAYHRILGYAIGAADSSASSEFFMALYDSTSLLAATAALDNIFDEAELDADTYGNTPMWYPYPKKLDTGLTIRQGCNTVVIIYYEDIRKF